MGKFLNKFKEKTGQIPDKLGGFVEGRENKGYDYNRKKLNPNNREKMGNYSIPDEELHEELPPESDYDENQHNPNYYEGDWDDEVGIQPAQKPESFHHFILENQYKDLEKDIRGYKDVWNKNEQKWVTKRKEFHCFTAEEAEMIVRTAQSHLATDIKLSRITKESFGDFMDAIYKQLEYLFERIAEYNYGRYGSYNKQGDMKSENMKIFTELWTRIQANYSRSIGGAENIATHGSVRGQESLQSGERDYSRQGMRGYS